jgi:hypothetical protein
MSTTETRIDPARLRQGARDVLADLAVTEGVIDALTTIVDEHWGQVYRSQSRIREIVGRLGCTDLADGSFDSGKVLARLDELDAAAQTETPMSTTEESKADAES